MRDLQGGGHFQATTTTDNTRRSEPAQPDLSATPRDLPLQAHQAKTKPNNQFTPGGWSSTNHNMAESHKGKLGAYKPKEHDLWMLKLNWNLRKKSRFAEEIVKGEHQCPEGAGGTPSVSATLETGGDQEAFQLSRLSRSYHPYLDKTDSSNSSESEDSGDGEHHGEASSHLEADELSEAMELHMEMLAQVAYQEGLSP